MAKGFLAVAGLELAEVGARMVGLVGFRTVLEVVSGAAGVAAGWAAAGWAAVGWVVEDLEAEAVDLARHLAGVVVLAGEVVVTAVGLVEAGSA